MEAKSESGTAPVVAWPRGVEGNVERQSVYFGVEIDGT